MIELGCLGPVRVRVDGAEPPPELLWRKHLALLIYLSRSPRGRSRDHLIGILWPEKNDPKARHSLNEALRVLRKVAGKGLVTEADVVRLEPGTVTSDVDMLDPGSIEGGFLEGFVLPDTPAFEEWLVQERERVNGAAVATLVKSGDAALAAGANAIAREHARRAQGIDARHEGVARLLMQAFALDGNRAQALAVFEQLRERLATDLSVEPDPATTELARRIRSDRITRTAPPSLPADTDRAQAVPLSASAGQLLVRMTNAWHDSLAGAGRCLALVGDPGTGKTRLADELAARARLDGALTALARALPGESPAATWAAILRGGLTAAPELAGAAPQVLAGLFGLDPDLATRFPAARSAEPLPVAQAFLEALFAIADTRPLMMVLDDAHHATAEVIASLTAVVQRAGNRKLCLLITASAAKSSPSLDALVVKLGRDVPGMVLTTGPLSEIDVQGLVRWAFPDYREEASSRLARRVLADTAGIPFLAVEYVQALRAGLTMDAGGRTSWPAANRTLDQTLPADLPEPLLAALRLRFRSVSEAAQQVLMAVAALDGAADRELLARATGLPQAETDRALDELEWERWLSGDARAYTFVTRLAGEMVRTDMITAGQRRRIRERAGLPG